MFNMESMLEIWGSVRVLLQSLVQIGLLTTVIYFALYFLQGTRAVPAIAGIMIVTSVGWILSKLLGLEVIEWLFRQAPTIMVFAVIIIFQPEIRRAFAEIGSNPQRLLGGAKKITETVQAVLEAAFYMGEHHMGAIIAIQRSIGMRAIADNGVEIAAPISSELLITIFHKGTPLHDGAVIVKDGTIVAAGCYLPLTQKELSRGLGTRHRAGLGLTEETDAVVIIVSEETGEVSLASMGRLVRNVDKDRLRRHLRNYLSKEKPDNRILKKEN